MNAIDRIRDEMAKSKGAAIHGVGEMVTTAIMERPECARAIEAAGKDKTLAGLYAKMKAVAKEKQNGGCYCMTPSETERVMREYYGIAEAQTPAPAPTPEPEPKRDGFDLDALLGVL